MEGPENHCFHSFNPMDLNKIYLPITSIAITKEKTGFFGTIHHEKEIQIEKNQQTYFSLIYPQERVPQILQSINVTFLDRNQTDISQNFNTTLINHKQYVSPSTNFGSGPHPYNIPSWHYFLKSEVEFTLQNGEKKRGFYCEYLQQHEKVVIFQDGELKHFKISDITSFITLDEEKFQTYINRSTHPDNGLSIYFSEKEDKYNYQSNTPKIFTKIICTYKVPLPQTHSQTLLIMKENNVLEVSNHLIYYHSLDKDLTNLNITFGELDTIIPFVQKNQFAVLPNFQTTIKFTLRTRIIQSDGPAFSPNCYSRIIIHNTSSYLIDNPLLVSEKYFTSLVISSSIKPKETIFMPLNSQFIRIFHNSDGTSYKNTTGYAVELVDDSKNIEIELLPGEKYLCESKQPGNLFYKNEERPKIREISCGDKSAPANPFLPRSGSCFGAIANPPPCNSLFHQKPPTQNSVGVNPFGANPFGVNSNGANSFGVNPFASTNSFGSSNSNPPSTGGFAFGTSNPFQSSNQTHNYSQFPAITTVQQPSCSFNSPSTGTANSTPSSSLFASPTTTFPAFGQPPSNPFSATTTTPASSDSTPIDPFVHKNPFILSTSSNSAGGSGVTSSEVTSESPSSDRACNLNKPFGSFGSATSNSNTNNTFGFGSTTPNPYSHITFGSAGSNANSHSHNPNMFGSTSNTNANNTIGLFVSTTPNPNSNITFGSFGSNVATSNSNSTFGSSSNSNTNNVCGSFGSETPNSNSNITFGSFGSTTSNSNSNNLFGSSSVSTPPSKVPFGVPTLNTTSAYPPQFVPEQSSDVIPKFSFALSPVEPESSICSDSTKTSPVAPSDFVELEQTFNQLVLPEDEV